MQNDKYKSTLESRPGKALRFAGSTATVELSKASCNNSVVIEPGVQGANVIAYTWISFATIFRVFDDQHGNSPTLLKTRNRHEPIVFSF